MPKKRPVDSDSSSDDEDLFRPTFDSPPKSGPKIKRKRQNKANATVLPKNAANSSNNATKDDEESIKATAKSKADAKMLPAGISNTTELVWYCPEHECNDSDTDGAPQHQYFPCRVCEASEARHVHLEPHSWDCTEVTLVQALVDTNPFDGRDRLLVNNSSLVPYHGNNNNNTQEWCPTLWNFYQDQRKSQARRTYSRFSPLEMQTTFYFLQRILEQARHDEYDSSEAENLSSDDDDDDDEKEEERNNNKNTTTVPSNNNTTNKYDNSQATSSIASDDLEVPYAENLCDEHDDDDDDCSLDEHLFDEKKPTEPLRPGDVIQYTTPIYAEGDKRGKRITTVLSTDPSRHPLLVLQNGEVLPSDTSVKRIKVLEHGQLFNHDDGFFRPIEKFKIVKKGNATVVDGLRRQGERVERIVDRNMEKFTKKAQENGFAPMDVFHKRKKKKKSSSTLAVSSSTQSGKQVESRKRRLEIVNEGNGTDSSSSSDDDSDSSVEQQSLKRASRAKSTTTTSARSTRAQASSDSSDSDSDVSIIDFEEKGTSSYQRKRDTKSLVAKLKEKGMKALDSDSDEHDGGTSEPKAGGKKASRSTKPASSRGGTKVASKKKASDKSGSKRSDKGRDGASKATSSKASSKTKGGSSKGASRKSGKKEREPVVVNKPGEWMTTRRDTRESLGVDSDVTSLASLPQSTGRSAGGGSSTPSTAAKSSGDKSTSAFSQESENEGNSAEETTFLFSQESEKDVLQDRDNAKRKAKRKAREVSLEVKDDATASDVGVSTSSNKKRRRLAKNDDRGSPSVSSLGKADSSTHRSTAASKSTARSSKQEDENVVDLLNSPPRKEKHKRASYGSRGKSRVELGRSTSSSKKRNKISTRPDCLSFHSSSSDESSVDMDKYTRTEKERPSPEKRMRDKMTRNVAVELDSDSSADNGGGGGRGGASRARGVDAAKDKSPVLDLTGNDSVDSSDEEHPAPIAKKRGQIKRTADVGGRTVKATSSKGAPVADNAKPASTFGLSLTKHNVRKRRPDSKRSKNRPLFGSDTVSAAVTGKRIAEASSDSDDDGFGPKSHSKDCGDWGTFRGDSQSTTGTSSKGSGTSIMADVFGKTASNGTSVSATSGTTTGAVQEPTNLFTKNESKDELVDSSDDDDDDLLTSQSSNSRSLPKKRLFNSSRWRSGASHSSLASKDRVPVVNSNKRQKKH